LVTILCVRFGNKYGKEYVERLRNMVSRHITIPYDFVCLTDDPEPIEGVRLIVQSNAGYAKGWWHKVHMFDPSLDIQGRILYFDLDVVVCGNIEKLLGGEDFYGIRDFNRAFHKDWCVLNSSVMSWTKGSQSIIWAKFKENPGEALSMPGDQDWIYSISKSYIKYWPLEWIMSYKWEIRTKEELVYINAKRVFKEVKDIAIPAQCSVLVFHGDPKPEDVMDPFIIDNWR